MMNNPDIPPFAKQMMEASTSLGIVGNLIGLVGSAFIIFAGMKMLKLEKFGLSMAGSIIAMVPCLSPCCCIGLPIGIWSLIVLNKPEVKQSFRS
jgi:hypothetical protein